MIPVSEVPQNRCRRLWLCCFPLLPKYDYPQRTTGISDCPLGVPKMHSGASDFPLWSIGLSSVERWPMLHRAFPAPINCPSLLS